MLRALCQLAVVCSAVLGCRPENEIVSPEPEPESLPVVRFEPENFGSWLSLDRAPDDERLTMAYYNRAVGALGYAVGTPAEDGSVDWVHERVDGYPEPTGLDPTDAGKYASQRTMPDGTVWVAYQEVDDVVLRVSQRRGPGGWSEPAELEEGGAWASLAIGADGQPVVAHCNPATAEVRIVRFDGQEWTGSSVYRGAAGPGGVASVSHTRLFVSGKQELLAFRDDARGSLWVAELGAGEPVEVDADGNVGAWPSIVAGSGLAVAYHDVGRQDLRVAIRDESGEWSAQVVDEGELRGADTEIFVMDGQLAVLYFDGHNNDMMLARQEGSAWSVSTVRTQGAVGYHNEVVQVAGRWWVGSYNHTAKSLFVQAL